MNDLFVGLAIFHFRKNMKEGYCYYTFVITIEVVQFDYLQLKFHNYNFPE